MEISRSLELHLSEREFETLINAVHNASRRGLSELEIKLRAAWRRALPQCEYPSITPDVG